MKLVKLLVIFLFISFNAEAKPVTIVAKVIGVSDGDTITVLYQKTPVKIRLLGIDCPEKKQDYGQAAKNYTSERVFKKRVVAIVRSQDRYGRKLATVIMPNKNSLNEALVSAGLAWWYRKYAPHDVKLKALEEEARAKRIGLWSLPSPIPPWDFRKKH